MGNNRPQALVLNENQMKSITDVDGLFGVCLIDGELYQSFVFMDKNDLNAKIAGLSVCPSGYSDKVAVLEYEVEMSALTHLTDFALSKAHEITSIKKSAKITSEFVDYGSRYYQGLKVKLTPWGLDVLIGVKLAKTLDLRENDKVNLVVSPCSRLLAIEKSDNGPELNRLIIDPESYSLDHAFGNVPIFIDLKESEWETIPYNIIDEKIVFSGEFYKKHEQVNVINNSSKVENIKIKEPFNVKKYLFGFAFYISFLIFLLLAMNILLGQN